MGSRLDLDLGFGDFAGIACALCESVGSRQDA